MENGKKDSRINHGMQRSVRLLVAIVLSYSCFKAEYQEYLLRAGQTVSPE